MRCVTIIGPDETAVVEVPRPVAGVEDVLVQIRACGICGSDTAYIHHGGIPPAGSKKPLGHEPAGVAVEVGPDVVGITVGDHVLINPMGMRDGILGNGGEQGALSEYVLVERAVLGESIVVIPRHIPFEVASLNEPMAVARRAVNRAAPTPEDKAVVFGAGPIGLGAVLSLRRAGVEHIVVVDVVPHRLATALKVGADAGVNSDEEDLGTRLRELQGETVGYTGEAKPATTVYIDAAGVPAVPKAVFALAGYNARLSIVALHKLPVEVDFGGLLPSGLTIVMSVGYPEEIFEVTEDLVENWEKYALIVSDVVPYAEVGRALALAATPGAADKVVVTFGTDAPGEASERQNS